MAEAIAEAKRGAAEGEDPIGAVAVIDDAMIARDHDRRGLNDDPSAHAVLLTIQAAANKLGARRLAEATIFTTHEPCVMCVGALLEARVKALVFAIPDSDSGAAGIGHPARARSADGASALGRLRRPRGGGAPPRDRVRIGLARLWRPPGSAIDSLTDEERCPSG